LQDDTIIVVFTIFSVTRLDRLVKVEAPPTNQMAQFGSLLTTGFLRQALCADWLHDCLTTDALSCCCAVRSDVIMRVGEREFSLHKCILAARSQVFKVWLISDCRGQLAHDCALFAVLVRRCSNTS
jgi:hypothetical protein